MGLVDNLSLLSQCLLGLFVVVDVRRGSVPANNASAIVPCGYGAGKKPAVLPVMPSVSDFDLVGGPVRERLGPLRHTALVIIRVEHQLRPVAGELLLCHAAIRE